MTKLIAIAAAAAVFASTNVLAGECPMAAKAAAHAHDTHMVAHVASAEEEKTPDIVEKAASIKDFSTLVAAVKAAGLVEALQGKGPFTVFAPTNKAFEKLPEGTLEELLKPENKKKLTSILLYHVVPGKVLAADVVKLEKADTLLKDKSVKIRVHEGKVFVDEAQVTKTDVEVANGVIHVIDSVILP